MLSYVYDSTSTKPMADIPYVESDECREVRLALMADPDCAYCTGQRERITMYSQTLKRMYSNPKFTASEEVQNERNLGAARAVLRAHVQRVHHE